MLAGQIIVVGRGEWDRRISGSVGQVKWADAVLFCMDHRCLCRVTNEKVLMVYILYTYLYHINSYSITLSRVSGNSQIMYKRMGDTRVVRFVCSHG